MAHLKKIKDLENLITHLIPKDYVFVDAKITKLTSSGDNYGSLLLAVDISMKNKQNEIKCIHAVAKKPPDNKLVQELFNCQYTLPNEVGFYQTIVPCLRQFQQERGITNLISCFPDFYSARISKDNIGRIDENSVLLIKNIKQEGFCVLDRTIGFNLEQSRLILEKMAELHATTLAFKTLKPEVFKEKLGSFFKEYKVFELDDNYNNKMIKASLNVIKDDDFCKNYLQQVERASQNDLKFLLVKNSKTLPASPFLTLTHCDLWVNNIMVKIDKNKVSDVKFIDFQLYEYSSCTRDVIFFLFSSVQTPILKQSCDNLLLHYFQSLIQNLTSLKCDTKDFTFDSFFKDIKSVITQGEFFHILSMLAPIFATDKDTKDVEALKLDDIIFHESEVSEAYREKACFIVKEFITRGWLI